ncbi:MAG TPA: site-2 protease family protein [Bryobacteraceae bacterium]|nr:site-2 protease family protein [Bryobacteraceae bacterium]
MRSQIKLGTVFGIKIGLHYSWFLIALLIVYSLSWQFHTTNAGWGDSVILAMAVATAILFFVSLLVHELAHSLVATANKLPVKEITLFALGGVSQIEKNPVSAKTEFWMAFVGPLTSAILGAICLTLARVIGNSSTDPLTAMLLWLGYINLMLAGFNLIPGYPLDGGRVLRALIWWKIGDADRSTQYAARIGQAVAFGFIAFGILQFFGGAGISGLWLAFIGWFLLQAARESDVQVGVLHALQGVRVADVMTRDFPSVEGSISVQHFVEQELLRTGQRAFFVLDHGSIAGLVTPHEIKQLDRAKWPFLTLHEIMRPLKDLHAVAPDAPLAAALESMSRYDLNQLPVISNSHLEGVLSRSQVLGYLQTHAELRG